MLRFGTVGIKEDNSAGLQLFNYVNFKRDNAYCAFEIGVVS
jgi:hypothetical protein